MKKVLFAAALTMPLVANAGGFAGIDIIGNYLTEINVTSPTGIIEINQLENTNLEKKFWNLVEKKI